MAQLYHLIKTIKHYQQQNTQKLLKLLLTQTNIFTIHKSHCH